MAEACTLTFRLTESPKPAGQQLRAKWRCGAAVWAGSLEPPLRALVLLGEGGGDEDEGGKRGPACGYAGGGGGLGGRLCG